MSKQDRQGVRTPAELERRYNFSKSFAEAMGSAARAQTVAKASQTAAERAQAGADAAAAAAQNAQAVADAAKANAAQAQERADQTAVNAADAKAAVDALDTKLNAEEIFNRLTNNGTLQGLFRGDDGELYINATYIKSGTLLADLIKAGVIRSKDGESVVLDLDKGTVNLVGTIKTETESDDDGSYMSQMTPRNIVSVDMAKGKGSYLNPKEIAVWDYSGGTKIATDQWEIRPDPVNQPELYPNYHLMGQVDAESQLVLLYLLSKEGTHPLQIVSIGGSNYVRGLSQPEQDRDAANKAYVDKALTEDSDYPGCYYRTVDGVKEWLNPPMLLGTEYRTTERWRGLAVYQKYMYLGVTNAGTVTLEHGITDFGGCLEIQLTDGSHQNITHHANIQSLYVTGAGVFLTAETAQTIYATIKYTKT